MTLSAKDKKISDAFLKLGKLYLSTHKRGSSGYCKGSCGQWTFGWDYIDKYYFKFGSYCLSAGDEERWYEMSNSNPNKLIETLTDRFLKEEDYKDE